MTFPSNSLANDKKFLDRLAYVLSNNNMKGQYNKNQASSLHNLSSTTIVTIFCYNFCFVSYSASLEIAFK